MLLALGIIAIVNGLLAASSLIAQNSRDAGSAIEKLRPAQGWVGIIGCAWGLWSLVSMLLSLAELKNMGFVSMVQGFVASAVLAGTGFLMGFSMISDMLASNREAKKKAAELYETLSMWQVPLGVACAVLGVWTLIRAF